ncbi:unnamed protein product, partial [Staurois parvus]
MFSPAPFLSVLSERRWHLYCGHRAVTASQPGAHCACVSHGTPPDWSGSLLGPVKAPRRLREQRGGHCELSRKWERAPGVERVPEFDRCPL